MQESKLILLLKSFEKEDWRWFRKFLLSPYFNNREELIVFFDYLRKQEPEFKPQALKKERVYKKIFGKESYDEKKMSYTMNFLLTQAEQFLAYREFEKRPTLKANFLQKSLVDKQLSKPYKYHYEKTKKLLEEAKKESLQYYLHKYQVAEIANLHYANQNFRHFDSNLQVTSDSLDEFYILNKLRCCCEMISRSTVMEAAYKPAFEKELIDFIETHNYYKNPIIACYLEAYYILKKEDAEANFEQLKKLLEGFNEELPLSERPKLYIYGINYCIVQIGKNNRAKHYVEQCLELYLAGIEQGILLKNGFLTPWTFKNVVKLGLNLKRYDFTEDFIQKYHKKLEEKYQEDALHFNLADVFYRKKNYSEAQVHLIQVQYSDIYYNIQAKAMLLKIYYEAFEIEALFSLLASFSIYLKRNKKLSKDVKEGYLNFTSILTKIVRAKNDKIPQVIEKINQTKRLNNRKWLLEICKAN